MKDRVSLHPGRVVLTPVPGQTNTYDMTMADQPTQVGDPPTKANLLSDATVAALNAFLTSALPANPKVTDALKSLATVGLGKIAYGSYIGTGTYGSSNPCRLTFPFTPKILIITAYGTPSSTSNAKNALFSRYRSKRRIGYIGCCRKRRNGARDICIRKQYKHGLVWR